MAFSIKVEIAASLAIVLATSAAGGALGLQAASTLTGRPSRFVGHPSAEVRAVPGVGTRIEGVRRILPMGGLSRALFVFQDRGR